MSRKAFDAVNCIAEFNSFRDLVIKAEKVMTESQFKDSLKSCGVPYNNLFWAELKHSGIVVAVDDDKFTFDPREKRINQFRLQNIYEQYRKKVIQYANNKRQRENLEKVVHNEKIQEAISLLKSYGFEVLAPVGMLYTKV